MIYRWFTDPHARLGYPEADHPTHGRIFTSDLRTADPHCEVRYDADQEQALLVYTATPGTESHEKLRLLSVVGDRPPHL